MYMIDTEIHFYTPIYNFLTDFSYDWFPINVSSYNIVMVSSTYTKHYGYPD